MPTEPHALQDLNRDISRLKAKARQLESQMDEKLQYLGNNYRSMALKTVLPVALTRTLVGGSALEILLENPKIRQWLNHWSGRLFDKISGGLESLARKWSSKS